jgi:hypothetical protein
MLPMKVVNLFFYDTIYYIEVKTSNDSSRLSSVDWSTIKRKYDKVN